MARWPIADDMFGDDQDDETQTDDGFDLAVQQLARQAEGPSVTASRLRGDEKYFPDCRHYLYEEQQPQHLILLTTSGWAFRTEGVDTEVGGTCTELYATADDGGVAICTDEELLVVVGASFCEVAYTHLRGILANQGRVELHATGNKGYALDIARSADAHETTLALDFLRRKVRTAASEKHTSRRS